MTTVVAKVWEADKLRTAVSAVHMCVQEDQQTSQGFWALTWRVLWETAQQTLLTWRVLWETAQQTLLTCMQIVCAQCKQMCRFVIWNKRNHAMICATTKSQQYDTWRMMLLLLLSLVMWTTSSLSTAEYMHAVTNKATQQDQTNATHHTSNCGRECWPDLKLPSETGTCCWALYAD